MFLPSPAKKRIWLLAALLAFKGIAAPASKAPEPPKPAPALSAPVETVAAKPPWGRIVVVGASASAGFTESEPLGGPNTPQYRVSRYLEAAVLVPHEPVRNLANVLFFMQPEAAGRQQIDQVLQARPTLVVGLDFLFWFCYGDGRTDEERLARFEQGLKLLEAVRCPLVVGDIPDASGASNNMLGPEQIPSARALATANRRLKQWAAARKQVAVVPLSGFMRAAAANQALTIHGHAVPAGKTRALLQSDQLHPSAFGAVVLALSSLDVFLSTCSGFSASEIRWDLKEVLRLGLHPSKNRRNKAPAQCRLEANNPLPSPSIHIK